MSENKINVVVKNTITSMPYTIIQASLLAYLISGDYTYGLFVLFLLIFGDGANALEKKFFKNLSMKKLGKRPSGCGVRKKGKTCTGCGIYPEYMRKSKTWGMPSGHAQILFLTATFWSLYLIGKHKKGSSSLLITQLIIIWLIALIVVGQRVVSKCHSIPQVIVGSIFGIGFGILTYFICRKINNKKFPKSLFIK